MSELKITLADKQYLLLPRHIAANILPDCDAIFLKIYIYAMHLAAHGNALVSVADICAVLSLSEYDVLNALAFWAENGMLQLSESGYVSFCEVTAKQSATQTPHAVTPLQSDTPPSYSKTEISANIAQSCELRNMFTLAQSILGKMLSAAAASILYSFYDWLGMQPDVIIALLQHCAELEKKDMRYIEKVAISWHQMGINSVAMADEYIKTQNKNRRYSFKIKKILGIDNRNLTATEQKHIDMWLSDLNASADLVAFAFDYCVGKTGKLSLAYMSKVLSAWVAEGSKTPAAAQKSIDTFASAKPKYTTPQQKKPLEVYDSGRYDYDEIDRIAREKLKNRVRKEAEHGVSKGDI